MRRILRAGASARQAARVALVLLGVAAAAACASRGFRPPTGPGEPAPEAGTWLADATARCRNATTFQGQVGIAGRVGDETVPPAPLSVGVTRADGVYIEARQMGVTGLWLSGTRERATLWLSEGNLFLTESAPLIVEALVGVRLEPSRLLAVLTGCMSRNLEAGDATQYDRGRRARVVTPDAVVYLHRSPQGWRVVAGAFDGLIAEVVEAGPIFPSGVRITSEPGVTPALRLRLDVGDNRVNEPMREEAFSRPLPDGATPMTLDDLRAAGPLKRREGGG